MSFAILFKQVPEGQIGEQSSLMMVGQIDKLSSLMMVVSRSERPAII